MKCCICGKEMPNFMCSNNPDGAAWKKDGEIITPVFGLEDRCCDECNKKFVIPGRLYRAKLSESKNEDKE